MTNKNLHSKHRERVRERYLNEGLDNFQPHQVLELILFYVISRKDTNELAHRLLDKFGSLSGVFEAHPKELMKVEGIGEGAAVFLNMFSQVRRRYDLDKFSERFYLNSVEDAGAFCTNLFYGRIYECFFIISLNSQNKVIHTEKICEGTLDEAIVYPRNIARIALQHNASKIIAAHNHPGGSSEPSVEDLSITRKIKDALELVDVELSDHIIVADGKYSSVKQMGLV